MFTSESKRGDGNAHDRDSTTTARYRPVYRQETPFMYDPTRDPDRHTPRGYGYVQRRAAPPHTMLGRDMARYGRRGRSESLLYPSGSGYRRDRSSSSSLSSSSSSASDHDARRRHRGRFYPAHPCPDYDLYHRAPRMFQSDAERRRFMAQQEYERELRDRRRRNEMYRGQWEQYQREQLTGHRGGGGGWGAKVAGMANRVTGTVTEGAGKTFSRPKWEQRGLRQMGRGEYESNVTARLPVEREYRSSRHGRQGGCYYHDGRYGGAGDYGSDDGYAADSRSRRYAAYDASLVDPFGYGSPRFSSRRYGRQDGIAGAGRRYRSLSVSSSSTSSSSSSSSSEYERRRGKSRRYSTMTGGNMSQSHQSGGILNRLLHSRASRGAGNQEYNDESRVHTGTGGVAGGVPPPLPPRPSRRRSAHN